MMCLWVFLFLLFFDEHAESLEIVQASLLEPKNEQLDILREAHSRRKRDVE